MTDSTYGGPVEPQPPVPGDAAGSVPPQNPADETAPWPAPPAAPAYPSPEPPAIAYAQPGTPAVPPAAQDASAGYQQSYAPPPAAGYGQPYAAPGYGAQAAPSGSSGMSTGKVVLISLLVALVTAAFVGLSAGMLGASLGANNAVVNRIVSPRSITVVPDKTSEPVVAAAAAASPSVVNIDVSGPTTSSSESGMPKNHPSVPFSGNGSGVAYKTAPNGGTYIITNNHVVANAKQITVNPVTGGTLKAKLVGRDPESDIAVIQVDGRLTPISVADSTKLQVGDFAVAIGSPFGLQHSVTFGVISAIGRSLLDFGDNSTGQYPLVDVIQTDAAINPGNSGGALVDRTGKLIGINTAIFGGSTDANAGIGFAIPSKTAARVADQIIAGEKVSHPFIGVIGETLTPATAQERKLTVEEGALIVDFSEGSGARKAGAKVGDVIVAADGKPVASMDDLVLAVRRHKVGEKVKLEVIRGGQKQTFDVTVGEKPADLDVQPSEPTTASP